MDILLLGIKDHGAAVGQLAPDADALLAEQVHQRFLSQRAQIPGDDEIEILRAGVGVVEVGSDCVEGGRRHGAAHVRRVADPQICDGAHGGGGDLHSSAAALYQGGTASCDGPLGGGGALTAVAQRKAVLPLGGCKVGRGHGHRLR